MLKTNTYADLEIRIIARKEGEGYPIELRLNSEREMGEDHLPPDIIENWTTSATPTTDGEKLFAWLMGAEAIKQAWYEVRGEWPKCHLRLWLDTDAPELHRLPWELLRIPALNEEVPAHDLAADVKTPFSRYLAGKWRPGSPIVQRPIKILVAIANPPGLADYELQPVEEEVETKLMQEATAGLAVELTELTGTFTLSDLEMELRKGYHILYFVGHGTFFKDEDQAILFMAAKGDGDEPALVSEVEFRDMLVRIDEGEQNPLRLIYLSSCQTATRSTADAFRGFAPALVQAGIPAVLAMQEKVPVDTAQAFAQTFFRQLLQHGQVDLAANEARATLMTGDYLGASIPVLFMRLRKGLLFGQYGQVLGEVDAFWDDLLYNVKKGWCTPFLGSGITTELLPSPEELAQTLAAENPYPFADRDNLLKVTQYLATMNNRRLRHETISNLVKGFKRRTNPTVLQPEAEGNPGELAEIIKATWDEVDDLAMQGEIHHQLAALELPIYLTTNFDNSMVVALERVRGVSARPVTVNWQNLLKKDATRPHISLNPPPSKEEPVVLHLFGTDADPTSMILTEDDYLDYLSILSRDYEFLLPTDIQEKLAESTLLFLGYRLDDLDLKLIMRGLLTHLDLQKWSMPNIAVQIEGNAGDPEAEQEVIRFFQRYFSNLQIDVYWGSTQQFVADLYARWQKYK